MSIANSKYTTVKLKCPFDEKLKDIDSTWVDGCN